MRGRGSVIYNPTEVITKITIQQNIYIKMPLKWNAESARGNRSVKYGAQL